MHTWGTAILFLIAFTFSSAVTAQAGSSSHGITHSRKSAPMGHTGYRSSTPASRTPATATPSPASRTYHPGVRPTVVTTHTHASDPNSYTSVHRKAEARKKKEEAKKKPVPTEVKSTNGLLSPPKPKTPKTVKPIGPFVTK